ncbi:hypothetical protein DL89DRAFT_167114 [Linderina pennispora]|uniref:Uncharacterized protein n=1 Tax=Linderina pennispora TaxID=61395 RepID=A0A1Y1VV81_9FUNG|nr:uncharacterized protein DL89DRAFT_167114 [Linderina pennispora]ORX64674.1 hypothetical protein DL89DRAFT_167114 [Linderina pennispora]
MTRRSLFLFGMFQEHRPAANLHLYPSTAPSWTSKHGCHAHACSLISSCTYYLPHQPLCTCACRCPPPDICSFACPRRTRKSCCVSDAALSASAQCLCPAAAGSRAAPSPRSWP